MIQLEKPLHNEAILGRHTFVDVVSSLEVVVDHVMEVLFLRWGLTLEWDKKHFVWRRELINLFQNSLIDIGFRRWDVKHCVGVTGHWGHINDFMRFNTENLNNGRVSFKATRNWAVVADVDAKCSGVCGQHNKKDVPSSLAYARPGHSQGGLWYRLFECRHNQCCF